MFCRRVFSFSLVLIMLCMSNPIKAEYPENFTDKLNLLNLLKQEKFTELDEILTTLQKAYEAGKEEMQIWHAFNAFANSGPGLEKPLNDWVKQTPGSFSAHIALANYHQNLGWHSRGGKWRKDTLDKQIAKMQSHFRVARESFEYALTINPKLIPAYDGMIRACQLIT